MKKLLILDDDQRLCIELQEIFESEGFWVKIVHDGISGKKILEKEMFDILLLDIRIPGLSGFAILRWLMDKQLQMKIIILTGRPLATAGHIDVVNEEEENLLNYADEVLNKPSKIKDIINKINAFNVETS